jgi:hypothetical protein
MASCCGAMYSLVDGYGNILSSRCFQSFQCFDDSSCRAELAAKKQRGLQKTEHENLSLQIVGCRLYTWLSFASLPERMSSKPCRSRDSADEENSTRSGQRGAKSVVWGERAS